MARLLNIKQINPGAGNEGRFIFVNSGGQVVYDTPKILDEGGANEVSAEEHAKIQPAVNTYQQDVLSVQTDATLDPGASPTTGDRYVITDAGALNANFGVIAGVSNNDIVEYTGSEFEVVWDASTQGSGLVYSVGDTDFYSFDGAAWDTLSNQAVNLNDGSGTTFNSGTSAYDLGGTLTSNTSITNDAGNALSILMTNSGSNDVRGSIPN